MKRDLLFLAGGMLVGGVIGYFAVEAKSELKARRRYEESLDAHLRVLRKVQEDSTDPDGPEETEDALLVGGEMVVAGDGTMMSEVVSNDYLKAVAAKDTDHEVFVSGGVNDYGISYLEEEEYYEDDGRLKMQITIFMHEVEPVFTMDGNVITDWDERVGDSILVDFYKLVPPGVDRVLYVRNHKTDEDYEVIQETP